MKKAKEILMFKFFTKYHVYLVAVAVTGALAFTMMAASSSPSKTIHPKTGPEFAKTAAMILAKSKTSGGSGVILNSTATGSIILTNAHVCEIIKTGGYVKTINKEVKVRHYKVYTKHDLCLVSVNEDLGVNTQLSPKTPEKYSESVTSGHPNLLPPIVSRGLFSQNLEIEIMVGQKPCDGTETGNDIMYCIFMGAKPVIKKYDSQVISSLIMAGSSGSAVFDSNGYIAGLVFAGSPDGLSYGFIVPHKYVYDFILNSTNYRWKRVSRNLKPSSYLNKVVELRDTCRLFKTIPACSKITFQSIWSQK